MLKFPVVQSHFRPTFGSHLGPFREHGAVAGARLEEKESDDDMVGD